MLLSLLGLLLAGVVTYTNPILHSDYSDPDVICVDDEFWMTASSFNCTPGLQILHSYDLVHWEIVNAALPKLEYDVPEQYRLRHDSSFDGMSHGKGVWAPSIRWHDGLFYIFWGDPDWGIYQTHTADPRGAWSEPVRVIKGKGMIDPCPLWDDDGKAYLVHAWAGSRAGFKSALVVTEMTPDATETIGCPMIVFDGNASGNKTVEGPKFYKRDGWYYIFAPAGGVKEGWQLALRSRDIYGPYEYLKVLHQGTTDIHGPHQGAWVEDSIGQSWFVHFEDRYAWGRVVHLEPMTWDDSGWCVIGEDPDGDGIGQPVSGCHMPASSHIEAFTGVDAMASGLDFSANRIPLNWQWHANPQPGWAMLSAGEKYLRLNCIRKSDEWCNLWDTPNLLLEKITGPEMTFDARLTFRPGNKGERAGLVIMGQDYCTLECNYDGSVVSLCKRTCMDASDSGSERVDFAVNIAARDRLKANSERLEKKVRELINSSRKTNKQAVRNEIREDQEGGDLFYDVWVRVKMTPAKTETTRYGMKCTLQYSTDGQNYHRFGADFYAREGRWIGAKIGFFAIADTEYNDGGYLEVR